MAAIRKRRSYSHDAGHNAGAITPRGIDSSASVLPERLRLMLLREKMAAHTRCSPSFCVLVGRVP